MNKIKPLTPILISLAVVFIFYLKRFIVLKFYPPIPNFIIFLIFFCSLFTKETIIQKFARMCGDKLEGASLVYTRNLTYVWCAFIFINFLITIWTIFLPDNIWIFYNGFLSYFLTGLLFAVEYIVRIIFKKRNNLWCWNFLKNTKIKSQL